MSPEEIMQSLDHYTREWDELERRCKRHLVHALTLAIMGVLALILAVVLVGTACADTVHVYRVPANKSMGGTIGKFVTHVNELNQTRTHVIVDLPSCSSSCTFYLLADSMCTSPRTKYGFHGPSNAVLGSLGVPVRGMKQAEIDRTVEIMAANYNARYPGLGDWFVRRAARRWGQGRIVLTGQALHDSFGVPLCPGG